jgi:hypothetical protein
MTQSPNSNWSEMDLFSINQQRGGGRAATVLEVKSDVLSAPSSRASWEGGADSAFGSKPPRI